VGYRDDLIVRLKDSGLWGKLSGEHQLAIQEFTDDQACRVMVKVDAFDMNDQRVIDELARASLERLVRVFEGSLIEPFDDRPQLTMAGELLAQFVLELRERGLSATAIDSGLKQLDAMVIAGLITIYRGPPA
jgi:hypothetical protein